MSYFSLSSYRAYASVSAGEALEVERLRISLSATESVERSKVPLELMSVRTCRARSTGLRLFSTQALMRSRAERSSSGTLCRISAVSAACWSAAVS